MGAVDPRPLTAQERQVLDLLLAVEYPGVRELRLQAETAVVVGRCDCGCPTFDVAVDEDASPAMVDAPHRTAPVELRVLPEREEPEGSVVLFVDDGRMTSVEYIAYLDRPPREWPAGERLQVFDRRA